MKKLFVIAVIIITCLSFRFLIAHKDEPVYVPPSKQRTGDADAGYKYMVTGDFVNSGLPLNLYYLALKKEKTNLLGRDGDNASVRYDFNAVKEFVTVAQTINDQLFVDIVGVNPADRLTALLIAHRDPISFSWSEKALIEVPKEIIPSDVPAWWLLKKKNAMFYNGFGRGDFGKYLMGSSLLTLVDTVHAKDVDTHMPDLLSYLYTITAPKYPGAKDEQLAAKGKIIFEDNCSHCHG